MMRFRLLITGLAAIFVLTTILSFRYLHAASIPAGGSRDDRPSSPVLVELFTSEGCSSCPPADALLERLDRSQQVSSADLIVLSEHVDYWNDIGWKDPYSSHEYSERQSPYASRFGLGSIYTPQMIVDGRFEFVGSDERRAKEAIQNATKVMKTSVSISSSLSNYPGCYGNAVSLCRCSPFGLFQGEDYFHHRRFEVSGLRPDRLLSAHVGTCKMAIADSFS